MSEQLPCGCRLGSYLCPQAEALWAMASVTYRLALDDEAGAWPRYAEAMADYYRHFNQARPIKAA